MNADDKARWLAPSPPLPIDEDEPQAKRESHERRSGGKPIAALSPGSHATPPSGREAEGE
jgi:hypothetical protein